MEQNTFVTDDELLNYRFQEECSSKHTDKYRLFKFFADEHNLILTDTEINDIIHIVKESA